MENDLTCLRYKDGREIQPSDNITLQAEGTMRRLIIRSAETSDAGSYTCQAGNNSIEFTVNVRGTVTFSDSCWCEYCLKTYLLVN